MSTRSDIVVHLASGRWARIYCHSDGYLEGVGATLFEHYTDQTKIEKLVALGDLSTLGPEIGKKCDFEWYTKLYEKKCAGKITEEQFTAARAEGFHQCKAYGRDRGDKGTSATIRDTLAQVWPEQGAWTEFTYVWRDGKWLVGDPDEGSQTLLDLGDVLLGKKILTPKVKAFGATIGRHLPHDPKDPAKHRWASSH